MDDHDGSRLLNQVADEVPVGPARIDEVVRTGKPVQHRGWQVAAALSAVALIVVGGTVVAATYLGGAGGVSNDITANQPPAGAVTPETAVENPTRHLTGPLPASGAASCVEQYGPEGVADRAFAFDGNVIGIDPGQSNRPGYGSLDLAAVTFAVNEWFSGGKSATVTVGMDPPAEHSLREGVPSYAIGSRLLVSGEPRWGGAPLDNAIAWGCDFTRYYDAPTANAWRKAITGPETSG